jgi:PAS domain S-box-containing protein
MTENQGQAARTEPQLFYDAFLSSPIGIAVENLEGRPLFVNPALCKMLELSEEEMRSKHCVQFSPPEDAEKDWALFQQLRAGSIDRYQIEKRFFRRDGSLIWGRLSISLLKNGPSPLVVAIVEDITEKRTAQDREHGVLETLDLVTKQMAAAVSRCSRDFRYLWVNQAYADWLERPLNEVVGRSILDVLGKDAFEAMLPHFNRVLTGEKVRYEQESYFQKIGHRWISATHTPTRDSNSIVNGWVAVVVDITERKHAEEALSAMSRKLLEAQESERARIARELHDDITQRLAMLSFQLGEVEENCIELPRDVQNGLEELRKQALEISTDLQTLSHELHSYKLEYLGLLGGMSSWCKDFGGRHKIEISFVADDLPSLPSQEISLCLFRVLQEALHNAAKHSQAKRIDVEIRNKSDEIHLTVRDQGSGFDVEAAMHRGGLGLASMQERVRLVHGTIVIQSRPMGGTSIHVSVPLRPERGFGHAFARPV